MFMCTDLTPGPEVKDMLIFVFLSVSSVCMLLPFFRKIKVILFLKDCDLSMLKTWASDWKVVGLNPAGQ